LFSFALFWNLSFSNFITVFVNFFIDFFDHFSFLFLTRPYKFSIWKDPVEYTQVPGQSWQFPDIHAFLARVNLIINSFQNRAIFPVFFFFFTQHLLLLQSSQLLTAPISTSTQQIMWCLFILLSNVFNAKDFRYVSILTMIFFQQKQTQKKKRKKENTFNLSHQTSPFHSLLIPPFPPISPN
jgi:hypothetical protein